MLVLNVPYVFDALGGPADTMRALQSLQPELPLNYATVQMWAARQSISRPWMMPALYACMARGHALSDLLVDDADPFGDVPVPPGAKRQPAYA